MKTENSNEEGKKVMDIKDMKVVILAGGFGTRIAEESHLRPKPMIEIGGKPILWHLMKIYSAQGFNDFVICAGYKQDIIKEYFDDYFLHSSDVTFDFRDTKKTVTVHGTQVEPWSVTVANTGYNSMTGGRVKRIQPYVGDNPFMLTYGDGLADVNLRALLDQHEKTGATVTLTGAALAQSKGVLDVSDNGIVDSFREKKKTDDSVINGGFMVCEPEIFDLISGDSSILEEEPLPLLAQAGKLACYKHDGFWKCMDTQRERGQFENYWASGDAPWKIWE
ncbi:MAG: glucose-1-phosphate cytidylyltransferase [Raoultibacter sp.]